MRVTELDNLIKMILISVRNEVNLAWHKKYCDIHDPAIVMEDIRVSNSLEIV